MKNLFSQKFVKEVRDSIEVLKDREKEILTLRFGLTNERFWTLENIGKKFSITRERARQIINQSKKRLGKIKNPKLKNLFVLIEKYIDSNGGIVGEKTLVNHFGNENEPEILGSVNLISEVNPNLFNIKIDHLDAFWTTKNIHKEELNKVVNYAIKYLKEKGKITKLPELINHLSEKTKKLEKESIKSLLIGSYNVFVIREDKIGLIYWPEINPKNTRNKVFYIFEQANKPLHFKDISERIKNYKFAGKIPSSATVHNELISDKRFILIGKGIYALRKWGYNEGTVSDLIIEMLKKNGKMEQEKIIEEVLEQRQVARNTIIMNLVSKPKFKRVTGRTWTLTN
jgi:DNA-directed RNA polymerase delta subunit